MSNKTDVMKVGDHVHSSVLNVTGKVVFIATINGAKWYRIRHDGSDTGATHSTTIENLKLIVPIE